MNEKLFRQKSIDRVTSPEDLNDYVRVSNPGVWLILAAVIALLIGACVWGIFGHIEETVKADAVAEGGTVICAVEPGALERIEIGMAVRIGDAEGTVTQIAADGITVDATLPDGVYEAEIVIASFRPMSFVFN